MYFGLWILVFLGALIVELATAALSVSGSVSELCSP